MRVSIDKKEAAKRQLETAVELFFGGKDEVSTHTLTAAAYTILIDISEGQLPFETFWDNSYIKPEKKKEFQGILADAENFFKHAVRDPERILSFDSFQTEVLLFDAARIYMNLAGENPPGIYLYHMWYMMKYPQYFSYPVDSKNILNDFFHKMRPIMNPDKSASFARALEVLKEMIAQNPQFLVLPPRV